MNHAIAIVSKHRGSPDDEETRQLVLNAIREEEIQMRRLLFQFCELPMEERRAIWTRIFTRVVSSVEDKKVQKKLMKECKDVLDTVLMDACDEPKRELVARSSS